MTTLPETRGDAKTISSETARKGQRLYVQGGMIPNYTGYVPRMYVIVCRSAIYSSSYGFNSLKLTSRAVDVAGVNHMKLRKR